MTGLYSQIPFAFSYTPYVFPAYLNLGGPDDGQSQFQRTTGNIEASVCERLDHSRNLLFFTKGPNAWLLQGIIATGPANGATRDNSILADINGDARADYLSALIITVICWTVVDVG
jgi:hypothetical protein